MSDNTAIEISAEEFERRFDEGEDMTPYLDMSSIRRPGLEVRRVNVDMPAWMVEALDREAARLNISRQAILKTKLDSVLKAEGVIRPPSFPNMEGAAATNRNT